MFLATVNPVAIIGNLHATASRNLAIRAFKLREETSISREDINMESVRVSHKDIVGITGVSAIGVVSYGLTTDATQAITLLAEYQHTVALEVTHEVFSATDGNIS